MLKPDGDSIGPLGVTSYSEKRALIKDAGMDVDEFSRYL